MLERASTGERAVLLQHAIDSIAITFYTQVMFADFELQAHRLVEQDQPITADMLNGIYTALLRAYYGDVIDEEESRGSPGRGSRTSSARRTTCISTRPVSRRPRGSCRSARSLLRRRGRRRRPVSGAAARRRQRPPDEAAHARRGRPQSAGNRPRCREELDMLVSRLEESLASA